MLVAVGVWLRFQHLELLEFKGDEAFAANRALEFVRSGTVPTSGLMSSVDILNPPLFCWLLIRMFFITSNVAVAAVLALPYVAVKWVRDPAARIPYNLRRALHDWGELFRIRRAQRVGWPLKVEN